MNCLFHKFRLAVVAALVTLCAHVATAAAPKITNLSVRGLQAGATTAVTITGSDLMPQGKLVTGVPVAGQKVLEGSTPTRLRMEITLAENVTPGVYNLRVANAKGISNNIVVAVDSLRQSPLSAETESLPVALHGALTGPTIARTSFTGSVGQHVAVEVEARRLGSTLRPVLHLYDPSGRQLAWSLPQTALSGDARVMAKLPVDGAYRVELHDLQYSGPGPGFYRLKIGSFHYADMVFPPAVRRGTKAALELIGNMGSLGTVELTAAEGTDIAVPWPVGAKPSGLRPKVLVSDLTELVETPPGDGPQSLPAAPVAVSGRLDTPGQEDVYRIAVTPGAKLRFAVFAARLGSPLDVALELRNDKGGRLALNDDAGGTADPQLDYTVPAGTETVDVAIKDVHGRGDARSIYRFVATPTNGADHRPDFKLFVTSDTHNVPQGAARVVQITAKRNGYDGPIKIALDRLPAGVTAEVVDIPAGCGGALVRLAARQDVAAEMTGIYGLIRVTGTSVGLDPPVVRTASFEKHPLGKLQPWLRDDVAVAMSEPNRVAFDLKWQPPADQTALWLGTKYTARIKLVRPPGAIGPVRLTLLSGRPVPVVNGRADANRAVRGEKATVDVPVDAKAKAAFDALTAADKALADAKTKAAQTAAAGKKTLSDADVVVKTSTDKQTAAATAEAEAATQAKTATDARAAAAKALADAQAALAAAGDADKPAAQAKVKQTTTVTAQADKTAAQAAARKKTAAAALAVAEKALADAQAKAQAASDAATKADDAATAAVRGAETKRATAEKSLRDAEAKLNTETDFVVIVPPSLTLAPSDLAFRAELRSLDNRTVLAEVVSPVRRLAAQNPLEMKLSAGPKFQTRLDAKTGATVKLTGTTLRKAGFSGDVTVTITGQPAGVAAPKVVLKPDKNEFDLELKFPANFKPGEVSSIKLVASGPPDPKAAKIVVRTETPLTIDVQPPEPQPATPKTET